MGWAKEHPDCVTFGGQVVLLGMAALAGPEGALAARIAATAVTGVRVEADLIKGRDEDAKIRTAYEGVKWEAYLLGGQKAAAAFFGPFGRWMGIGDAAISFSKCAASL